MKKLLTSLFLWSYCTFQVHANNIQVANVKLSDFDANQLTSKINFDITWENSWRTSTNETNHDGAWIFAKYRKVNTSDWRHATLNTSGMTVPSGAIIQVSNDGKGAWMYRSNDGQGSVNWTDAKVIWNYGVDGLTPLDSVEIKIFAIEMVYIPQGQFYLGCGGSGSANQFKQGAVTTLTPFLVASNDPITIANTTGNLYFNTLPSTANGDHIGTISQNFPKGYKAFWLMKYEASQQQLVDFYNLISSSMATYLGVNTVATTGTHPNLVPTYPYKPYHTSLRTLAAYADWTAMRPYTELEYEKACRGGNNYPIPNEYAWGTTTAVSATATSNNGQENELVVTPANANCFLSPNSSTIAGSGVRTGVFATATSTRQQSGAGYYGNMEMSGNLNELVIYIGDANGRAFTDVNGNGQLVNNGDADVATWPASGGYKARGGSYSSGFTNGQLSDRSFISYHITGDLYNYALALRVARSAE